MARPRKQGMDYFPHDTDALNDEKLESLTVLYGAKGYAFYFILLERIYRTPNYELEVFHVENRTVIAQKCFCTLEEFDKILKTALRNGCFDEEKYREKGILTSHGIKKRAQMVEEKRANYRQIKEFSIEKTPQETHTEMPQSKVKESKSKSKKKGKNNTLEMDEKSPSPRTIMENFINNHEQQQQVISALVVRGIPNEVAGTEIQKFISYWSERTKNGKHQRWETERTFELQRRLTTWFSNISKFKGNTAQDNKIKFVGL